MQFKICEKNHEGVLLLLKLLTEVSPPWCFSRFFKLHKWYQIVKSIINIIFREQGSFPFEEPQTKQARVYNIHDPFCPVI